MTDWDQIENDWRFGDLSNVKLAKKHGVSEGAIRKRAKAEGWQKGVKPGPRQPIPPKDQRTAAASQQPAAETGEKPPLNVTLDLALRMMDELNTTTSAIGELEDLIYKDTENDRDGRRRTALLRAVSLKTRSETLKIIQQAIVTASTEGKADEGKKAQRAAEAQKIATQGSRFTAGRAPLSVVK